MTTLKAIFVDRNASNRALAALAHDDIYPHHVDVEAERQPKPDEKAEADFAGGSQVGGAIGSVLAGAAGAVIMVATGGAGLIGTAVGVLSGATAGGMVGSAMGGVVGGSKPHVNEPHTTEHVVLRFAVDEGDEPRARLVVEQEGGVLLGPGIHA